MRWDNEGGRLVQDEPPSSATGTLDERKTTTMTPKRLTSTILLGTLGLVGFIVLLLFLFPAYDRYQARANANNRVKVSNIEIRNQAQRVRIAQQSAQIRYQNAVGIRKSQDEIAKTLTPLYVAFEMTQALQAIATSGQNNSVIYLPTNPANGLPVVPVNNLPGGGTK